jgi:hypothetical protein
MQPSIACTGIISVSALRRLNQVGSSWRRLLTLLYFLSLSGARRRTIPQPPPSRSEDYNLSALPQHDERVTCLSCRFSYPSVRGFCPMCGTPAPAPQESAPGPRPVESKSNRRSLFAVQSESSISLSRRGRKRLMIAALIIIAAYGFFRLRSRGTSAPGVVTPASAVAASPPVPVTAAAPVTEEVANLPSSESAVPVASPPRAATPMLPTNDPAELWKRVQKGNTDAEVVLAKLYLSGEGVPQSCDQAHLLLLAAANRRNRTANEILSRIYPLRCP